MKTSPRHDWGCTISDDHQQAAGGVIRCLLCDDHEAMRHGVAALLGATDDVRVVGEAGSAADALARAEAHRPDVVVLDIGMPGATGLSVCRELVERALGAVVVYTGHDDVSLAEKALETGARAFVAKRSPMSDLVRAIRVAAAGETFIDGGMAAALLGRRQRFSRNPLSPRERQVLQLLSQGMTTEAVAGELSLRPTTVQDYAESAMAKLEASNRVHAVALALRGQFIEGPAAARDV